MGHQGHGGAKQLHAVKACISGHGEFHRNLMKTPSLLYYTRPFDLHLSALELTPIGGHVAPAGHEAVLVGHGAAGGQRHRLDEAVEGGGAAQLDQHDVVVQVVAVVVGVLDEPGRVDPLLGALVHRNVVLAQAHLYAAIKTEQKSITVRNRYSYRDVIY